MKATTLATKDLGPLHQLLLRASPKDKQGRRSVPILAAALRVSEQSLYQAIKRGSISPIRAKQISELARRRVKFAEFIPFFHGI